jgi:hypothetical protein
MRKSATNSENAQHLHDKLEQFVTSLLVDLDDGLDKRLVRTFLLAWWSSAEVWVIPGPPMLHTSILGSRVETHSVRLNQIPITRASSA